MTGSSTQLPSASSSVLRRVSTRVPRARATPSTVSPSSLRAASFVMLLSLGVRLGSAPAARGGPVQRPQPADHQRPLAAGDDAPRQIEKKLELAAVDVAEQLVIDRLRLGGEGSDEAPPFRREAQQDAAAIGRARLFLDMAALDETLRDHGDEGARHHEMARHGADADPALALELRHGQ